MVENMLLNDVIVFILFIGGFFFEYGLINDEFKDVEEVLYYYFYDKFLLL